MDSLIQLKIVSTFKIILILFLFTGSKGITQTIPITSQIFDQKFSLIPSLSGIADYNSVTLTSQKQWIGLNKSPYTFIVAYNGRIGNFDFYNPSGLLNKSGVKTKDRLGFGIELYTDNAGFFRNSGIKLAGAYHYPVGKSKLSLGYSLRACQHYFQNDKLTPNQSNDPLVPEYNEANYFIYSDFGLSYHQPYQFYAGVAVHNLFNSKGIIQKNINISDYYNRGFSLLAGKYFQLKGKVVEPFIKVSVFGNESFNSLAGVRYFYKKGCWISIMGNNNFKEINGNLAFLYRKFSYVIGYSYYTGVISNYQKGSVEFSIVARFGDLSRIKFY